MYAELTDYAVYYSYQASEAAMIEGYLQTASSKINILAKKYNFDIAAAVEDEDYLDIVKSVCINAAHRAVDATTDTSAPSTVTGFTQSAMGYSLTTQYSNRGQTLYITKAELKELGFLRQRLYGIDMAELMKGEA